MSISKKNSDGKQQNNLNMAQHNNLTLVRILTAAMLVTSCATTQHIPIGLPTCEAPIPVTEEIWNDLDKLRETMSHNQLVDEKCIELLRKRIELHDASAR